MHGAGIERSCSFERKKRETVMATINTKVGGAVNLMRLTWNDPVRTFVGFGSVSGRLGSNGQTDYCVASDLLCKLCAWYRAARPGVTAVGFHWHPWAGVGMAANPETMAMLERTLGPTHMPSEEGVRHLVRELYAHVPRAELLITTWEFHARYYGTWFHPKELLERQAAQRAAAATAAPASVAPSGADAATAASSVADASAAAQWDPLPFEQVVQRHELKMIPAPLSPAATAPTVTGPVCIYGDNPGARALHGRLAAMGVAVHVLPVTESMDDAKAAVDAVYASQPPRTVFLMCGRDENAPDLLTDAGWKHRREVGIVVPFMAMQHLFRLRRKAKDANPITLVAATALGGDFGLSGNVAVPEGGAMTGLMKSLYVEDTRKGDREVFTKAIDFPAEERPEAVVDAILRELAADAPDIEVGWSRGQRSVLRSFERPVESLPRLEIPRGGTWVITGGARGITAAAAMELAKRYSLKLHLVGYRPHPSEDAEWRNCTDEQLGEIKARIVRGAVSEGRSPEKEWERVKVDIEIYDTLRKFAEAGIPTTYHSCDLADWTALAGVLDAVRTADGPIDGIVHGAGYAMSGRFDMRSDKHLDRTLAGKVAGAVGLMALTQNDPVRCFIGFGSIGGRYGANGLADYAAANDTLAKLFDWYRARRPNCAACCFHWQSWDEVGMAMLGDSAVGTKGILKMHFIKPREGVEHLCREIEAGLPLSEVLITDGFFEHTFYPFAAAIREGSSSSHAADAAQGPLTIESAPLVESVQPREGGGNATEIRFNPAADPFLLDHQLRGRPLLPAVVGIEAIAESAALSSGKEVVAVRNVEIVDALSFHTDRATVAHVNVVPQSDGALACELVADFHNRAGKLIQQDRLHYRAAVDVAERPTQLDLPMPQDLPQQWHAFTYQSTGPLYHGPTLHGLTAAAFGEQTGWGKLTALSLPRFGGARPGHRWLVHAPLLDSAFYLCGVHLWYHGGQAFSLPHSIGAARLGRIPRENEQCLVRFECRSIEDRFATYDFAVFGDDQKAILHVNGHRVVVIKQ